MPVCHTSGTEFLQVEGVEMAKTGWNNPTPTNGPVSLLEAFGITKGSFSFPSLQAVLPGQVSDSLTQQHTVSGNSLKPTGGNGPGLPGGPGSPAANQKLGKQMVTAAGWGQQWDAFNQIVLAESGWQTTIHNGGGFGYVPGLAYGIPQALPGSKMASAGANWQTSAATQIKWMIGYIRSVYGDPNNAWAFHKSHGWY
jgi:hypothetical protein